MTHPFHPLHGRELVLVGYRRSWGKEYVEYDAGEGRVMALPLGWTDAGGEDPQTVIGAGRSWFRVEDLVALVALIEGLR